MSLIAAPDLYRSAIALPWETNEFDLDLSAALRFTRNTLQTVNTGLPQPVLAPQVWADFDYSLPQDPNAQATLAWTASEATTAHFILIWFDTYLFDEIRFTSAPGRGRAELYACDLLPLERPLEIAPKDTITLDVRANLVQKEYIYSWDTTLRGADGQVKAAFRQSTFYGNIYPGFGKQSFPTQ